jgi:phosphoenolpyruvate synthase/pyruvate phosphate dikinase
VNLRARESKFRMGLDKTNLADLMKRGKRSRDLILNAGIPDELWAEIRTAYPLCHMPIVMYVILKVNGVWATRLR